jgi:hypothetical protein
MYLKFLYLSWDEVPSRPSPKSNLLGHKYTYVSPPNEVSLTRLTPSCLSPLHGLILCPGWNQWITVSCQRANMSLLDY